MTGKPRIVVVGGGFGGLAAIKQFRGVGADVTIIDRRNHHLFQPLLYQVATSSLGPSDIAWPIRHLLHSRDDVKTVLGDVVGIDTAGKLVKLDDGFTVPYDYLVLATGARHAYFGHDDWEPHAPGLKTLEDAIAMRRRLLLAFEKAEIETDVAKRQALLTFAIVGGGATGVELAGAIVELARYTLRNEFRSIHPEEARVVLIEAGDRVLPAFKPALSAYALKALAKLGVDVRFGKAVTTLTRGTVQMGAETLAAETIIWAAGVLASPAAKWLGAEADRAGRLKVNDDLSVPGHSEIFAAGDTVTAPWRDGRAVPGIGDAAKQGGRHAARVIRARIAGNLSPMPFRYAHLGDIATIGRREALIDFGWIKLTGWLGWWIWGAAHIYFLIGLKNRLFVALNWLWIYFFGYRGARLITEEKPPGKPAPQD
jgi:NADH:ubiquinone reductase (H+-translocating)